MNKFTERLNSLMIETNINQSQLAKETGISQGEISRWLTGERKPNIDYFIILARYFKCSIDYLVGLED